MAIEYPWYRVDGKELLEQGDFIDKCPTFIPEYHYSPELFEQPHQEGVEYEIHGEWREYNVVVMNQSCDIQNGKLKFVLVCPHWSLEELGARDPNFLSSKTKEEIRRGNRPGYHMLNASSLDTWERGIRIVEFLSMHSIPYDFLRQFAARKKRLRLLTPYREKLSRAFGDFFGRVGLPQDIPPFPTKK